MRKIINIFRKIITIVIIVVLLLGIIYIYKKHNVNEYIKAEYKLGLSNFERDGEIKYSKDYSYKIENTDYNDAMYYQTIKVTKETPYRVTCMVKTENVKTENENKDAGAHICIGDTIEKSSNVTGTTNWQKLEFIFNSKDREEVDIGFRLGGYDDNCIGTAWFSDMKIESGTTNNDNTWNFLCVMFNNIDVKIDGKENVKLNLTESDKYDMRTCIQRFKSSMEELSANKIHVNYDIVETDIPITKMSYDEANGYYVYGYDVKEVIDSYIEQGKYDHIFIIFRTSGINEGSSIPVNDWIGLGSMEYRGIGFSNIRLPDSESSYIYKYNTRINTFPEEVFVHEFLHTLERNSEDYKYERPELHDYEIYGYKNEKIKGLKNWYIDYMNKNIKTSNGYIGLSPEIFTKKPAKSTDFTYSHKLNYFKEPENIIEELNNIFYKIINLISAKKEIVNEEI